MGFIVGVFVGGDDEEFGDVVGEQRVDTCVANSCGAAGDQCYFSGLIRDVFFKGELVFFGGKAVATLLLVRRTALWMERCTLLRRSSRQWWTWQYL